MNFPDEIKMIKFEYKGQTHKIPLDAFADAMDRIVWLACKASRLKIPALFNWLNSEIEIPITDCKFPLTNDPEVVCAHLLYYGILEDFKFQIKPSKAPEIEVTKQQIDFYQRIAKYDGKRLYEWVYEQYKMGESE